MGNVHLVTGYKGEAHITSADQGALNAAVFGEGQYVLDCGNKLSASAITNNNIRVLDGDIMMQGRHIRINPDEYVDLTISNGTQGQNRNDLIVARYTKTTSTNVEDCSLVVIEGTASASTASDPAYASGDILGGNALQNDMPLYRVALSGINITAVTKLFEVRGGVGSAVSTSQLPVIPVSKGGTGATTASAARVNLGAFSQSGGMLSGNVYVQRIIDGDEYKAVIGSTGTGNPCIGHYINGEEKNFFKLTSEATEISKPLTVASGGTGATTASAARANLKAEIDGLVHAQYTVSSDADITSKLNMEITDMKECSARYIMLSVSGSVVSLESGTWHLLITKLTTSYALVTATRYSISTAAPRPMIKYKSLVAKNWTDWYVHGTILDRSQYGSNLPTAETAGRVFFKLID